MAAFSPRKPYALTPAPSQPRNRELTYKNISLRHAFVTLLGGELA
jgi:hypothetical protein